MQNQHEGTELAVVLDDEKERRRKLAVSVLLEYDGNKIAAIKRFMERFDVDIDKAREYINWAEAKILGQPMPPTPDMMSSYDETDEPDNETAVSVDPDMTPAVRIDAQKSKQTGSGFDETARCFGSIIRFCFKAFLLFCKVGFFLLLLPFRVILAFILVDRLDNHFNKKQDDWWNWL